MESNRSVHSRRETLVCKIPELFDVAFGTQLVGSLAVVSPFHVRFLILPVPRLDEDDVALFNPDAVFHPTGNPAESGLSVLAPDPDVVPAIVAGDYSKELVVVWHPEIPAP